MPAALKMHNNLSITCLTPYVWRGCWPRRLSILFQFAQDLALEHGSGRRRRTDSKYIASYHSIGAPPIFLAGGGCFGMLLEGKNTGEQNL